LTGIENIYSLSPIQRLYIAIDSQQPEVGLVQLVYGFSGDLVPHALEQAWHETVNRHTALRTTFFSEGLPEPVQIVHFDVSIRFEQHDWREFGGRFDEKFQKLLADDRKKGLDYTKPPCFRLCLIRQSQSDWRLLWTHPRLLVDGYSLGLIWREVAERYRALVSGRELVLPTARQFSDYIAMLRGRGPSEAQSFWRNTLDGFEPPVAHRRERRTVQPTRRKHRVVLGEAALSRLAAWRLEREVTLGAVIHGLWALLTAWHTERDDVVIGFAASGRPEELPGVEEIVGLFTTSLPLRIRVDARQTLGSWLLGVQQQIAETVGYQHSSLLDIQAWSGMPANQRLFDTLVVFQNAAEEFTFGAGVAFKDLNEPQTTNYPVTLLAVPGRDMKLWLLTDDHHLRESQAQTLLENLLLALTEMPGLSDRPIGELLARMAAFKTELTTSETAAALSIAPARDTLELQLIKIWESVFHLDGIGPHDDFFDLGGHSILAIRMLETIERVTHRKLPLATLLTAPTVAQLAAILRDKGWSPKWASLIEINPAGSRPPFFCFHAGGGHVLFYKSLAERLGVDQPFYGVQMVLGERWVPVHKTVEEMASFYIREMRELQPEGPYYLGGASFGGIVAFEVAQQLKAAGHEVGLLALFDTFGPGYPAFRSPRLVRWAGGLYRRVQHHFGSLLLLEEGQRGAYVRQKVEKARRMLRVGYKKRKQATERALREVRHKGVPAEIAYQPHVISEALEKYKPEPYCGRITLFRAQYQPIGIRPDREMGWGGYAFEGVEVIEVPGYHAAIVVEPRVRFCAQELQRCLEAAYLKPRKRSGARLSSSPRQRSDEQKATAAGD
jgi:thioesterase domain-containing protein